MRTGGQGGRFDATNNQDKKMTGQLDDLCTNFVLTEGMGVKPPRGWAVNGVETRSYFDKKVWERRGDPIKLFIDTPNWIRGTRHMSHVPLELVFLHNDDRTLLLGGGHLPAHLNEKAQRLANEAALAGLKKKLLPVMKDLNPDITTLFFDVNRDLKLEKNRELLNKAVRGTGLKLVKLPKPDLGGRFISCFLTTGNKPHAEMIDRISGYDHRGGLLTVTP